ncbi:MAG: glycosyltransferase family 2 protein [Proteobacteria bacterium]|nr:glycosyltransferase family 2 protein [Pseudomonadota bacterium]
MPQLTIGITYFNEGELLTRCLKSFWSGKVKPSEILIYDDASTLRPEAFIPSEIPARVIRSEVNQGPARGRNLILKEAKDEWIHFHDSDDWVSETWCEKITAAASGCDLVLTEVVSYRDGQVLSPAVVGLKEFFSPEELLRFAIHHFILVPAGTFKVELARNLRGYRESLWQSEDWDFYVRLASLRPAFKVIPESLSAIEVRNESRSQKKAETLTCLLQAILLLQEELPPENRADLSEKAAWAGSQLFQIGEKSLARDAFQLAQSLGPARYPEQKMVYRWLASRYGQEAAEWISLTYRKLLPKKIREKFSG